MMRRGLSTLVVGLLSCAFASTSWAAPPTATRTADGRLVPIYPVNGGGPTTAVGFDQVGATITAYAQDGASLWERTIDTQALSADPGFAISGGFDFEGDGWPDAEVALSQHSSTTCAGKSTKRTKLLVVGGRTGAVVHATDWMQDHCAPSPANYPVTQWTLNAPMFGLGTSTIATQPQYYHTGWLLNWNGTTFQTRNAYYTPLEHWYEDVYTEATPHTPHTQPPNGLIARGRGVVPRLTYWTSNRIVQYSLASSPFLPFPGQLVEERRFDPSGGNPETSGRLYGLVTVDLPSDNLGFLAGAPTWTLFQDMLDGEAHTLPLGGIERWAGVYNPVQDTGPFHKWWGTIYDYPAIRARRDAGNPEVCKSAAVTPDCYEKRLLYPANPWVRTGVGPSRLAYNVYRGGHWYIHITAPGTAAIDVETARDAFLWDIRDLDGDGVDEWLISPTRLPHEPDVPGYYFTHWTTYLQHWNESTHSLTAYDGFDGIPYLKPGLRTPTHTTSDAWLYPALAIETAGQRKLAVLRSNKQLDYVDIDLPGG